MKKPSFKVGDLLWDGCRKRLVVLEALPICDRAFSSGYRIDGIDSSYYKLATEVEIEHVLEDLRRLLTAVMRLSRRVT